MADKLWDLANFITGFAIAQNLATTFAMAKGEFRNSLKGSAAHIVAFVSTIVFTILYFYAIWWCESQAINKPEVKSIEDMVSLWKHVTVGRLVAVALFTVVTLMTLIGHWQNRIQGETKS
jgi:hypothetical protein